MGIIKRIKKHFKRKEKLNILNTKEIVNIASFDPSKKTVLFVSRDFPTHDKDSGSNRLKEIIFIYKELGYNCIVFAPHIFEDDFYVKFYKEHDIIVCTENKKYKTIYEFLIDFKKSGLCMVQRTIGTESILPENKECPAFCKIHLRYGGHSFFTL